MQKCLHNILFIEIRKWYELNLYNLELVLRFNKSFLFLIIPPTASSRPLRLFITPFKLKWIIFLLVCITVLNRMAWGFCTHKLSNYGLAKFWLWDKHYANRLSAYVGKCLTTKIYFKIKKSWMNVVWNTVMVIVLAFWFSRICFCELYMLYSYI